MVSARLDEGYPQKDEPGVQLPDTAVLAGWTRVEPWDPVDRRPFTQDGECSILHLIGLPPFP
jgi:hypothetical protein